MRPWIWVKEVEAVPASSVGGAIDVMMLEKKLTWGGRVQEAACGVGRDCIAECPGYSGIKLGSSGEIVGRGHGLRVTTLEMVTGAVRTNGVTQD